MVIVSADNVRCCLVPRLENQFLDWNLRALAAHHPPDPDIVIIDIDEYSLKEIAGEGWGRYPWSRAVYVALLEGLAKQEPATVVFDIVFSDPTADQCRAFRAHHAKLHEAPATIQLT